MTYGSMAILGANPGSEALIKQLVKLGHNIVLIDEDNQALQHMQDKYDIVTILGHPSHPDVLSNLPDDCKYLIAMTLNDETNLLACQIGRSMQSLTTLACIADTHFELDPELGFHANVDYLINTNSSVFTDINHLLQQPQLFHANQVSESFVCVSIKLSEQHAYNGKTLSELPSHLPASAIIAGLFRNNEWIAYRSNIKTTADDIVLLVIDQDQLPALSQTALHKELSILGASPIGEEICQKYQDQMDITVIEKNKQTCQDLSEQLSNTTIIHADPQDQSIIKPFVCKSQTVLCASTDDENNLIYAFQAHDCGAKHLLNLISHIREGHVFESSPIEHMVLKPQIISDHILRDLLSRQHIHYFYTKPNFMQISTLMIYNDHPYVDQTIAEINLDPAIIIGCIFRDGKPMFTNKNTVISVGDQLLLYAKHHSNETNPLENAFLSYAVFFQQ